MTCPRETMPCPDCGGTLDLIDEGGAVAEEYIAGGYQIADQPLPVRIVPAIFAACTACEFCLEVRR